MNATSQRISPHQAGVALAVLAATGFALKAIFIKFSYAHGADALDVLTLRLLFCVPLILAVRAIRRDPAQSPLTGAQWRWLIMLGLCGYYFSSLLDFLGLQTVSASLERLILTLYPAFTLIMGWLAFGNRIPGSLVLALPLSLAGTLLVASSHGGATHGDVTGMLLILGSTLSFAVFMCFSAPVIRQIGATRFTELALLVSATALVLHYLLTRDPQRLLDLPVVVWTDTAIMAVFCTVLPVYAMTMAMDRIGPGRTALIGSVGPILSIGLSMALLGEHFSGVQWAGAGLVLCGAQLASRKGGKV
ncbi:DMT family transporter [Chitinilyticum piscinae]|uniref:EamA family transporter n=1 Tax=Chitinilyticum piscinae TaxID=2866724 RepID=A0A8J7K9E1_9NEIS|nr:DMT family transporter [Chitinilyticum piscinae]MBE9607969.1 EamA family transporter [Chitinilyticum piscinae]